jgi:hypothetical protein
MRRRIYLAYQKRHHQRQSVMSLPHFFGLA